METDDPCMKQYGERHTFFKLQSGVIWGTEGHWQVLQKEGFPSACLEGGGRFYFAHMRSTRMHTDLGVCAPASCDPEQVRWEYMLALHHTYFMADPNLQYAAQVREYRDLTPQRFWSEAPPGVLPCVAAVLLLALVGRLARSGRCRPTPSPQFLLAHGPLPTLVLAGLVAGEVTLHTRWTSYEWHARHSPLFAAGRAAGEAAARLLPALQLLGLAEAAAQAASAFERRRPLARLSAAATALAARLAGLTLTGAILVLAAHIVQPMLSVNIFSGGAWLQPGWTESLVECVNRPPQDVLLGAGWLWLDGSGSSREPCPHLGPFRGELRLLVAAAPLLLLAPLIGAEAAALAAVAGHCMLPAGLPCREAGAATLAAAWLVRHAGSSSRRTWPLALLAAALGAVQASVFAAPPRLPPHLRAVLPPLLLAACAALGERLAPALMSAAVGQAVRSAVMALPLVVFVLEGYIEPHAKWLSLYDWFVRCAGVLGLCLAAGSLLDDACEGLLSIMCAAWGGLRACGGVSARCTLEDASGAPLVSCRLPAALLLLAAGAAAAAGIAAGRPPSSWVGALDLAHHARLRWNGLAAAVWPSGEVT